VIFIFCFCVKNLFFKFTITLSQIRVYLCPLRHPRAKKKPFFLKAHQDFLQKNTKSEKIIILRISILQQKREKKDMAYFLY
jgi:hypothetical protein